MISIIAAISRNNVIGRKGEIPWYLPSDLKRFAALTTGHSVIMGRKTFESIIARLGHPLPRRTNIVLSTTIKNIPGATVVSTLEEAWIKADPNGETFVIGGETVYAAALPFAQKLYLTKVDTEVDGDAAFPVWNQDEWRIEKQEPHQKDEKNEYDFSFIDYVRK